MKVTRLILRLVFYRTSPSDALNRCDGNVILKCNESREVSTPIVRVDEDSIVKKQCLSNFKVMPLQKIIYIDREGKEDIKQKK